MAELIFQNIAIVCLEQKIAKVQDFKEGINVVTSSYSGKNGNWVGKSSLLKSLYHVLGADSNYGDIWENEGKYLYILSFKYNNQKYTMLRHDSFFKLFDSNNVQLFSLSNRLELAEELDKLFHIKMKLKKQGEDNVYGDALPVYWYLLNFVDQFDNKPCVFESFNSLYAFKNFYSDVIYSQLGVRNSTLNETIDKITKIEESIKSIQKQNSIYQEVFNELKKRSVPVLDEQETIQVLEKYKKEYSEKICELNNSQKKLEKAYSDKAELEALLDDLEKLITKQKNDIKQVSKECTCPRCGSKLEDSRDYYFRRVKDIDGFALQKIDIETQLSDVERVIREELKKYDEYRLSVQKLQDKIKENNNNYKESISYLGLSQTQKEIATEIANNVQQISINEEQKRSQEKIKRELFKQRNDVDEFYHNTFHDLLIKYPLSEIDDSNIQKADSKFAVGGTANNLAKVLWISALLRTRFEKNKNYPLFPIVFDTPNNADLDCKNKKSIFNIIFDLSSFSKQIVTSLVGFDINEYPEFNSKINVISLNNEARHLLSKGDYEIVLQKYKDLKIFE